MVFGAPQPRGYAEMQNNPSDFVFRKHEGEALFSLFFVEIDERHLPSPFPAVLNDTTCQNPDVLCVHAARIWPNA